MWKKPCKTGDPNRISIHPSEYLLTMRGLNGPTIYMPSYNVRMVRYFPCLFFFHSFKTYRLDILIGVSSRLEVFLPMLSLLSLGMLMPSLTSWRTCILSCSVHETSICNVEGPFLSNILQDKGFLNSALWFAKISILTV